MGLFSRDGAAPSGRQDSSLPEAIRQLEREAREAYRRVLSSLTIGSLVDRARAEREEPTYSI
jgi:DNA-binding IscR family transcriptional regulator